MKIKNLMLFALVLVLITSTASAQTKMHKHKAPHGGIVEEAGSGLHIEMVKTDGVLLFYVLDAKQKTLSNKAISGTAVFQFFNGTKSNSTLEKSAKNALVVDKPRANKFTFCTVSLVVNKKTITGRFQNDEVSLEDIQHGHEH